jgi:hypothetical protein
VNPIPCRRHRQKHSEPPPLERISHNGAKREGREDRRGAKWAFLTAPGTDAPRRLCLFARRVVVVKDKVNRQADLREVARVYATLLAERVPDDVGPHESADVAVVVSVDPARQDVRPCRVELGDAHELEAGRTGVTTGVCDASAVAVPTANTAPPATRRPTSKARTDLDVMCPPRPLGNSCLANEA